MNIYNLFDVEYELWFKYICMNIYNFFDIEFELWFKYVLKFNYIYLIMNWNLVFVSMMIFRRVDIVLWMIGVNMWFRDMVIFLFLDLMDVKKFCIIEMISS